MFHIFPKEFQIDFQIRRWNYLNRKWNYFYLIYLIYLIYLAYLIILKSILSLCSLWRFLLVCIFIGQLPLKTFLGVFHPPPLPNWELFSNFYIFHMTPPVIWDKGAMGCLCSHRWTRNVNPRNKFKRSLCMYFCQNTNLTSAQRLGFMGKWLYTTTTHHHQPHKLNVSNISAVTDPIWMKL